MGRVFYTIIILFNTAASAWRARDEPRNLAFIFTAYADMALLFWCFHAMEKLQKNTDDISIDQGKKQRLKLKLKLAVLALSTTLSVMFCYRLSEMLPLILSLITWLMALLVSAVGFFALFVYCPTLDDNSSDAMKIEEA